MTIYPVLVSVLGAAGLMIFLTPGCALVYLAAAAGNALRLSMPETPRAHLGLAFGAF